MDFIIVPNIICNRFQPQEELKGKKGVFKSEGALR